MNPTTGLELPAVEGRRERIASPAEAEALLAALPERDRAIWATAMYAGLRRGELLALRWEDVDLAAGVIHVERSWDAKEGVVAPKSRAARRTVPIAGVLREHLVQHTLRSGRRGGLVFGTSAVAAVHAVEHPQAGERGLGARGPRLRSASTSAATPSPR